MPNRRSLPFLLAVLSGSLLLSSPDLAEAQIAGGGGGGNNQNQNNNLSGIAIDANGVVTPAFSREQSTRLSRKRLEAFAAEHLSGDLNTASPCRKVSLVRLEEACQDFAKRGAHVPADMHFLAGLQRIDYVYVMPETGDLVIAGPAEGFAPNDIGRVVGISTGRPPLRIDDLMVALRTVPVASLIGCSIDPVPENLARFNEYLQRNSTPATPAVIRQRFQEMTQVLGRQSVSVLGVPPGSHYAAVLVEADYRMKLISVGLERPAVSGFRSHLQMIGTGGNTLQRWWFAPFYEEFHQSEDGLAFQFSGQRVQLMSQDEHVNAAGQRQSAGLTRVTTQEFAKQFTDRYSELADSSPVFAELQNLVDLAVLAALIRRDRLNQRVNWSMDLFLDDTRAPLVTGETPAQVASVCNYRNAGRIIVGLVGGGVSIVPERVLRSTPVKREGNRDLDAFVRDTTAPPARTTWWWD